MADLAQATDDRAAKAINGMRTATVVSVAATGGAMVSMNGATVGPYAVLGSYSPRVNDTVTVIRQDATWLILGPSGMPTSPASAGSVALAAGWSASLNHIAPVSLGGRPAAYWVATLVPGTKSDGTTIGTIPSGLAPRSNLDLAGNANITVAGGQSPHFGMGSNGSVTCWGFASATGASVTGTYLLDV
jgi:hypothetical protein